jgi:lipopolysaccharide/colanic/teichoic acid biosynthesis glycosyltransferase
MNSILKRTFDFWGALVGIILFSPLYLIIFIGQKLTYTGPAVFGQERIGKGGKPFNIYKFRTMIVNNESDGIPQLDETDDEHITRFGKFLCSHHLDELPQLWNVLKGDMSFVGPRPERKYFIEQIMLHDPRYEQLYAIRPGVTSYATLYNGYTDTIDKMLRRLELDLYYMENYSWRFDINILWKTFVCILFGKKF